MRTDAELDAPEGAGTASCRDHQPNVNSGWRNFFEKRRGHEITYFYSGQLFLMGGLQPLRFLWWAYELGSWELRDVNQVHSHNKAHTGHSHLTTACLATAQSYDRPPKATYNLFLIVATPLGIPFWVLVNSPLS